MAFFFGHVQQPPPKIWTFATAAFIVSSRRGNFLMPVALKTCREKRAVRRIKATVMRIGTSSSRPNMPGLRVSPVTIDVAIVVAESLLFGVFLVLFSANLYLRLFCSLQWKSPVVWGIAALSLICTAHWALTVIHFIRAFWDPNPAYHAGHYAQSANIVLTMVSICIGDAIIVCVQS
ncbi:hypothetical protein C8F01DRAFT_43188 [Mycena amicta]|nr:hypothetical protein C8F01DRAFT_43188 [Mycena amicta]